MKILCSFVIFVTLVTISKSQASQKPVTKITTALKRSTVILVGSDMKLEWTFKFQPVKDLDRIFLFRYSIISKAKNTIALKKRSTGLIQYNPQVKGDYECNVHLGKDGVGTASISIKNILFNHSGVYGVGLKSRQEHVPKAENSISLKVVDMVAANMIKLTTVKSWVGHKTTLTCPVIYRGEVIPTFQWFKSRNELKEGITSLHNISVLKLEPKNKTAFGEYICKAKTKIATVIQKFLVVKLEYPIPPTGVKHIFYKERKVHTVFWKHGTKKHQYEAKEYVIEVWKSEKQQWKTARKTSILSMSFPKLKSTIKVRVCSSNEIGYNENSCSEPILLVVPTSVTGKPGKRSRSHQLSPCLLLVLITIFISSLKTFK